MLFPSIHFTQCFSLHFMPLVPRFLYMAVSVSSINFICLSQIVFWYNFRRESMEMRMKNLDLDGGDQDDSES